MERSDELRELMLGFYDALANGDVAFVERNFSRAADARAIGTDPQEWWSGPRVVEVFKEQVEAMGGRMPFRPGDPEAYVEGSVGWVADQAAFILPDGGELPFRVTCVLHREDGDWKFVQSHASVGVVNEEAFGELPT
jgi:ketosteroid isomerase-like protein